MANASLALPAHPSAPAALRPNASRPLSRAEIEAFGVELDALRARIVAQLGASDARYIYRIRHAVRLGDLTGRGLLFAGVFPPAWLAGGVILGIAKILENMELGHNVIHGQYDWMNDPELRSTTYEWDNVCPAPAWQRTHNYIHHTYTNVLGHDDDIGYGLLRIFPEQPWKPVNALQPLYALILACLFQWGVGIQDMQLEKIPSGRQSLAAIRPKFILFRRKVGKQLLKDYVVFPLLAGPAAPAVFTGNMLANLIRNVWAFSIIFCGHFTQNAEVFPESVLDNETRGDWYLRQIKGSSNFEGGPLFHILSGNLSHQIEHHLYPDIPANRYAEIAVEVQAICARYGQHYNTGRFSRQFFGVLRRIVAQSFPTRPKAKSGEIPAKTVHRNAGLRQLDTTLKELQTALAHRRQRPAATQPMQYEPALAQ